MAANVWKRIWMDTGEVYLTEGEVLKVLFENVILVLPVKTGSLF